MSFQSFVGGPQGWGVKAYIVWYGFSNFFIPLVILAFCYLRISYVIWENFNQKTINLEECGQTEKDGGWKAKIYRTISSRNSTSKLTWLCSMKSLGRQRNKKYLDEDDEVNQKLNDINSKRKQNPGDEFRVQNEESLEKIHWQKQSDYCDGKFIQKETRVALLLFAPDICKL